MDADRASVSILIASPKGCQVRAIAPAFMWIHPNPPYFIEPRKGMATWLKEVRGEAAGVSTAARRKGKKSPPASKWWQRS